MLCLRFAFDSAANPLTLPDDIYLAKWAGRCGEFKGDISFTRERVIPRFTGKFAGVRPRRIAAVQFDRNGKFTHEIRNRESTASCLPSSPHRSQDNIWIVDQMAGYVMSSTPGGMSRCCWGEKRRPFQFPSCGDAVPPGPRLPGQALRAMFSTAHRCGMGRRRQHFRGRRPWQRSGRKFNSKGAFSSPGLQRSRPGLFRNGPWHCCRYAKAMSMSPTVETSESSVFGQQRTFMTQYTNVELRQRFASRRAESFLYSSNQIRLTISTSAARSIAET